MAMQIASLAQLICGHPLTLHPFAPMGRGTLAQMDRTLPNGNEKSVVDARVSRCTVYSFVLSFSSLYKQIHFVSS